MTNTLQLNIVNNLKHNNIYMSNSVYKLTSGFKINTSSDNPSGLAISENMVAQIRGLDKSYENSQNAISLIQVAEGGLQEVNSILDRLKEISVQATNGTNTDSDRIKLDEEAQTLKAEIDKISNSTHFNGIKLLNGNLSNEEFDKSNNSETNDEIALKTNISNLNDYKTLPKATVMANKPILEETKLVGGRRQDVVNFDAIVDGTSIVVEGAVFEFDDDGKINDSSANVVDIKGLDDSGKRTKFKTVFNNIKPNGVSISILGSSSGSQFRITYSPAGTINVEYKEAPAPPPPVPPTPPIPRPPFVSYSEVKGVYIQVGGSSNSILFSIDSVSTEKLGIDNLCLTDYKNSSNAISSVDNALETISSIRAKLGALQNRFECILNILSVSSENLNAANSLIKDCDISKEVVQFGKFGVINESNQILLAQSSANAENVLQLL